MKLAKFLIVLWMTATAAISAPLATPLAVTPDAIGADLQQTFIAAPGALNTVGNGFVAYRRQFTLGAAPASATMHLFADARYVLWVNGAPVHRGPNRFESRGPQYDTVEIGSALQAGSNTIALVVMGNASNARMMNHPPALTLRLDIGGATVLRTDTAWKCSNQTRYRPASVTWPDIIDRIDTRVEDGDWTLPGYNSSAWSAAVAVTGDSWGPLAARRIPLLRDTPVAYALTGGTTLPATRTTGQQINFTLSRLVQAYSIIDLETTANTQLTLNYAGGITYFAKAGRQIYISSDSYAFNGGSITVNSGQATIHSIQLVERIYPFDLAGSFNSSDPLLNKLWAVCARSGQVLSEDAYVDCADRERAEWMDCDPPAFDVTRTAMSAPGPDGLPRYADARLSGEMLRRTALTLQSTGWVKAHTCSDRFDIHAKMEDRACDWIQGARRYYESTGDPALIREIWPVIVTQLNYFLARKSVRGLVRAREWVVWGNPIGYYTCEGTGLNAFVYKALSDAAYLGQAIGQNPQAATFAQAATDLAAAMNTVLWDETSGNYFTGYYSTADQAAPENSGLTTPLAIANQKFAPSMFSALWMLDQGVVPEARKARVTQYLIANRAQSVRIMTFYYLFLQLYQQHTAAFDMEILNTLRTKWSGMANSAYQTTWEEFEGGSIAHVYGMFPGYFLSAYTLGVRLDGLPSAKKLLIEPRPGDLTFADGNVVTELGVVPVSWRRLNGGLEVTCTVPPGVTAKLRVPRFNTTLPPSVALNGQSVANVVTDGRYVVVPVSAGPQVLTVSSELTWQGGGANVWDSATVNWLDATAVPSAFIAGANANFNDAGSNTPAIALTGVLAPAGVSVNATKNYTFGGSGSLGGTMTLTKSGPGTLTLATVNSHSGGTALNGGTLSISSGDSLGSAPLVFGGGRLALTANVTLTNSHLVGGASPVHVDSQGFAVSQLADIASLASATGGLRKSGAGTYTLRGNLTYAGPTLIDGGTLKLGPKTAFPNIAGLLYRLDASNPASLTLSGTKVAGWKDADGGTINFTQVTAGKQPQWITNTLNGLPVVRFAGAQQLVMADSTSPREIVAVTTVKGGVDGNIGGFLGINNADTGLRLNSSPNGWAADGGKTEVNGVENTVPGVGSYAPYTANQPQVVHRYQTPWGPWGTTGFGQYFSGGTTRFYNGDVAEVLVYGSALTPADRIALRTYLNAKWLGAAATAAITTLPAGTGVTLATTGSIWDLNGATQTIASLAGVAGTSVLLGGGTLTISGTADTEFAGSFSGAGSIIKSGAGILTLTGNSVIGGGFTNSGTTFILGGTLEAQGGVTNNGTLRLLAGASLGGSGPFVNNGLLDLMTGSQTLPANFVNNGSVLDRSAVKVNSVQFISASITIRITSYAGHNYQLQASDDPGSNSWGNLGAPQSGTGEELVFIDAAQPAVPRKFYRIAVSP